MIQSNILQQALDAITGIPQLLGLVAPSIAARRHMPRTDKELTTLNVQERVMLSAAIASGTDAVAYYTPDGQGSFTLRQQMDVFDLDHKHPTKFAGTVKFKKDTFTSEQAVRENGEDGKGYHIPVYNRQGEAQGIIVLHAPQKGYSRVQKAEEVEMNANQPKDGRQFKRDAHEPADVRLRKLRMAEHVVAMNSALLLEKGAVVPPPGQDVGTPEERHTYFLETAKDLFATFPKKEGIPVEEYEAVRNARSGDELRQALRKVLHHDNANQGPHLASTGDIMKYTVDALNEGQPKPVLDATQGSLAILLAMHHDDAKALFSSAFWQDDWKIPNPSDVEKKEQAARQLDFDGINASHAFNTEVQHLLYPASARMAGHHHHGDHRYDKKEENAKLGAKKAEYLIPTEDTPERDVSTLSRLLRVADVAESITGQGVDKPMADAVREMAAKAGAKYKEEPKGTRVGKITEDLKLATMNPNSIDADCLCFMIAHGVFHKYGEQRDADEKALFAATGGKAGNEQGWQSKKLKVAKYDAAALTEVESDILVRANWMERDRDGQLQWTQHGKEAEARLRKSVAEDTMFAEENRPLPMPPLPPRRHTGMAH